jgi:hypothetical protein
MWNTRDVAAREAARIARPEATRRRAPSREGELGLQGPTVSRQIPLAGALCERERRWRSARNHKSCSMTTISSHARRLGELMASVAAMGSREQLSELVLASTKGIFFFWRRESICHGVFIKRTCSGWSSPAGVHMVQGVLGQDGFVKADLVVLILDADTVRALEQVGEVGFEAGGPHTMTPGVVRGCQPPSTKTSLSYSPRAMTSEDRLDRQSSSASSDERLARDVTARGLVGDQSEDSLLRPVPLAHPRCNAPARAARSRRPSKGVARPAGCCRRAGARAACRAGRPRLGLRACGTALVPGGSAQRAARHWQAAAACRLEESVRSKGAQGGASSVQRALSERRARAREVAGTGGGTRRAGDRTRLACPADKRARGPSARGERAAHAAHATRGRGVPIACGTQRGKHARA